MKSYQDYPDYANFHYDLDGNDASTPRLRDEIEGLPRSVYCDIYDTLDDACAVFSVLEIWDFDAGIISGLTKDDIVEAVNTVTCR